MGRSRAGGMFSGRKAGLLLHPTSLPGPFGVGDFGPEAESFLAWAAAADQKVWQVLPLHPSPHGSPYGAQSAFAGNPLLISPERLREEGLVSAAELPHAPVASLGRLGHGAVSTWKDRLLRHSWESVRADSRLRAELDSFRAAPEQAAWLADWTL